MNTTIKGKISHLGSYPLLDQMGKHYGHVKRVVFCRIQEDELPISEVKKIIIAEEGITARQFNAIRIEVQALIAAYVANKTNHMESLCRKKEKLEKALQRAVSTRKRKYYATALTAIDKKLIKLKDELKNPSICFGGRKLFYKQFNLKANGYSSLDEWREDWREARRSDFFLVGSKDEKLGNQSCQLLPNGNLELRLTHTIAEKVGATRIQIPVDFTYDKEKIRAALAAGQALSFRFVKVKGSWYVHLSFDEAEPARISNSLYGYLGIDFNPSCIACTHVNGEGNLVDSFNIPVSLEWKRSEQTEAILGEAIKKCVEYAKLHGISIAIEELDFSKKKEELLTREYNRMLSNFAYSLFHTLITRQCFRAGIECKRVNPAYTSIIGKNKYAQGYGLSAHMAAAMVIARRALGFNEALRTKAKGRITLPRRNRAMNPWSDWRAQRREARCRKKSTPCKQRSGRNQGGQGPPSSTVTTRAGL